MKTKPKIECPVCGLIVAVNTNGILPRHKPRWREGPNSMSAPVCFGSGKTRFELQEALEQYMDNAAANRQ